MPTLAVSVWRQRLTMYSASQFLSSALTPAATSRMMAASNFMVTGIFLDCSWLRVFGELREWRNVEEKRREGEKERDVCGIRKTELIV